MSFYSVKPKWKEAPNWANWLVMGRNHCWWWHREEPMINKDLGFWRGIGSHIRKTRSHHVAWEFTKEQRPELRPSYKRNNK
jgi:hypothetical protein